MASCEINRDTIVTGIKQSASRQMKFSGLFDNEEDDFTPKSWDSDYQSVVDRVNSSFQEEIVFKVENPLDVPFFTIVEPSDKLVNSYLSTVRDDISYELRSVAQVAGEDLTLEQENQFRKLQQLNLISQDSHIVNGKTYYKIPDYNGERNYNSKDRLEEIIANQQINWINIIYGADEFLIELGMKEQLPEYPDEPLIPPQATSVTKSAVLKWLDRIGFRNIQMVSDLTYKGNKIPGSAYVDFANGVMQIVEGTEDYTLPEEAMHILVELSKESRPQLYSDMKKQIINYQVYRDVLNNPIYTGPLYQNEDGTRDYDKIKDEAIAKMLVMHLTDELQGTETVARAAQSYNWWQQLFQWIKEKFGLYKNPFKRALEPLNNDDVTFGEFADISNDDIFLSAKSTDEIDQNTPDNKAIFEAIRNRPQEMGIYKIDSDYYKDGQKVAENQRVSALTSDYYRKLFGDRNFDEALEAFYDQSRKDGTYIHEVFEENINAWIDPQTGLMKRNPSRLTFPLPNNPINVKMSKEIQQFVKGFMAQYPTGTRFITEQIIYDPNAVNKDGSKGRYGTVDFMAVLPDGTIDIIDWKSMLLQDLEGAKDYKREGIFIQLNEYKRILKAQYGAQNFGKIRAIPVKKFYKTFPSGRVLTAVHIGSPNAAEITQEEKYLRPIISPQESTGSESRDEIITKLEALYQKYIDKGYFQKDRNILNDVQEAIYEIRTSNSVDNLANYFVDLRTKFVQILGEEKALKESNSKDDISEALAMITFYEDIMENVVSPSEYLQQDPSIDKESRNKLYRSASDLNFLLRRLRNMRASLLDTQAQKVGVYNLLSPEKIVNLAGRYFRSMGSQNIASVRYMYELVKKAYNRIDIETDDLLTELKDLKSSFEEWKRVNKKDDKEAIGMLVDFERAKIHSKIDRSFYEERDKIVEEKKASDILTFVRNNYDLRPYTDWYDRTLAENKRIWEASTYDQDPKKNAQIIKNKIDTFEKNYNIYTNPITAYGFHNTLVWSRNIKEENWYSPYYKELLKPQNEALLDVYNFMVERNKELAETGSIRDYEQYTFIPNVKKTFADILSFDDTNWIQKSKDVVAQSYNNWRRSLSVEDYELNYQGARDPFTGEKLEKRFVPFVSKLDNDYQIKVAAAIDLKIIKDATDTENLNQRISDWRNKSSSNNETFSQAIQNQRNISFDIFTIYGLMSKEIQKEKYLSQNDEILRSLVHIERTKPNLLQNKFGTVATDSNGKPLKSTEVGKNAPILEEHVRAVVNGESLQYDADYTFRSPTHVVFKLKEKWNKSSLGKMYQFDTEGYNPTNVSATKFLLWLNTANQKRILGLNAASAISNLFGGSFSSSKLYQKYLSKDDLRAAWFKMTSGGFYQSEAMKKNAALVDYFLPLLQNREAFKASQLSVNDAAKVLSQEWLMAPMRKTSETVQLNIFLALIDNTAVIDGKLVNIRELAAEETNYLNRYSLKPSERATVEKAFNTRIKELKEKYSLSKVAQFKTEKVGGKDKVIIDIPGISRNSEDVARLREISQTMAKDSLGEADEFDVANYKYSIWWRLFMTFKNWIPRMADVRYGEFRYDQAHQSYEYGRFRMFARSLSSNYVVAAAKLVPIPYLTGKATKSFGKEALIQRAKEVYDQKLTQAQELGTYNPETFISEGEFVDKFIQGTESTYAELRTLILMSVLMFAGLASPDDDDDASTKAWKALIRKQIDKLSDEVGFFYSPKSGIDIAGGGAPVFSIVRDSWNLGSDIMQQFFGFTFEQLGWDEKGEKMQESAKPVKRSFKVFPVLKEILTYLPAMDEETAKEWGVKISDRRSF